MPPRQINSDSLFGQFYSKVLATLSLALPQLHSIESLQGFVPTVIERLGDSGRGDILDRLLNATLPDDVGETFSHNVLALG